MDVKELLEERGVKFQSKGRDYQVHCFNPEHDDNNPSMNIDKISGVFNCLSCGYAGDIFKYYNVAKKSLVNEKVLSLLESINKLVNKKLHIPLDAVYYNSDYRNIKKETLRRFKAFTVDRLQGRDFEGRLIFPIMDISNKITNFQGRFLFSDLEPKYINVPEKTALPMYPAVVNPIKHSIILVEGIFDMIKEKQKKNIERLLQYKYQGIDAIYIMFDGDKAGKEATKGLKKYISNTFATESIDLEDGMDPGKLTQDDVDKLREVLYG